MVASSFGAMTIDQLLLVRAKGAKYHRIQWLGALNFVLFDEKYASMPFILAKKSCHFSIGSRLTLDDYLSSILHRHFHWVSHPMALHGNDFVCSFIVFVGRRIGKDGSLECGRDRWGSTECRFIGWILQMDEVDIRTRELPVSVLRRKAQLKRTKKLYAQQDDSLQTSP